MESCRRCIALTIFIVVTIVVATLISVPVILITLEQNYFFALKTHFNESKAELKGGGYPSQHIKRSLVIIILLSCVAWHQEFIVLEKTSKCGKDIEERERICYQGRCEDCVTINMIPKATKEKSNGRKESCRISNDWN